MPTTTTRVSPRGRAEPGEVTEEGGVATERSVGTGLCAAGGSRACRSCSGLGAADEDTGDCGGAASDAEAGDKGEEAAAADVYEVVLRLGLGTGDAKAVLLVCITSEMWSTLPSSRTAVPRFELAASWASAGAAAAAFAAAVVAAAAVDVEWSVRWGVATDVQQRRGMQSRAGLVVLVLREEGQELGAQFARCGLLCALAAML
jgi:hypothetical protein